MPSHPLTNFEIKKYYQANPNLMMFIQEINYLKKGWDVCNKSWSV